MTEADLAAEEAIIRQSLSEDEDVAARLLADLRERRGLGPVRFAALLKRNAGLRRLVEDQVTVTEPAVRQAYRLAHGPAARVRLIVMPTLRGGAGPAAAGRRGRAVRRVGGDELDRPERCTGRAALADPAG